MSDAFGGGWSNSAMPGAGIIQHFKDRRAKQREENSRHSERVHEASLAQQNWMDRAAFAHLSATDLLARGGPKSRLSTAGVSVDSNGAYAANLSWHPAAPRAPKSPTASAPTPLVRTKPSARIAAQQATSAPKVATAPVAAAASRQFKTGSWGNFGETHRP